MSNYKNLPAPSPEQGLNRYMQDIRKFPMLEPEEEYMLAKRWVDHEDTDAAHKMVTSHLRLAAKIAMGYRGYGLPQAEVISEANVGLMQAVKKFDPEKGFRLATYAMWWIRASIQEYVLRSWSMVKLGTTSAQKKLFFNLRKAENRIGALEWQDWLEDESVNTASDYEANDEMEVRRALLAEAMDVLNDREKDILMQRRLAEETITLEDLSGQYNVSRERIRQIEVRAFEKLQKRMQDLAKERGMATAH